MIRAVLQAIRERRLLHAGDRVGVAVSGGGDSVALLLALNTLRDELGLVLSVVHVDHKLRGEESEADKRFVADLTASLGLPFHCAEINVREIVVREGLTIEAAARRVRYDYFRELIADDVIDLVATAHTRDDQAETVLHRFTRGSGTLGHAGIHPAVRDSQGRIEFIRPMLGVSRDDVEAFLREQLQPWRHDSSNELRDFTRNRIRHDILPMLERELNPNLRQVLSETAEIAREEQSYWDQLVESELAALVSPDGTISHSQLLETHTALLRRLLRGLCERFSVTLDFHGTEQLRAFILNAEAGTLPIAANAEAVLQRTAQGLRFCVRYRAQAGAEGFCYQLAIPGSVAVPECGLLMRIATESPVWAGRVVLIRNWRPGDRFQPFGRGKDKLKRWLQEFHIAQSERANWPVAEFNGEILWVRGLPPAAALRQPGAEALVTFEELPMQEITAAPV